MNDISLDEDYAAICGCTQEELDKYFAQCIRVLAAKKEIDDEVVKNKIEQLYKGFSFDGKIYLYNPDSLVNLFKKQEFDNFWFESATPTYIEKFLANKTVICSDYISHQVPRSLIRSPKEIEDVDVPIFLYQSGYLTLRVTHIKDMFSLVYPNEEVGNSMLRLASSNLFASSKEILRSQNSLVRCFENDDVSGLICEFGVVLAFGGYDTYAMTAINPANYECYIRDTLAAFLCGTYQINVSKEVFGSLGRADIVTKLNTIDLAKVYVFELKMLKEKSTPEGTLLEAKEQIL